MPRSRVFVLSALVALLPLAASAALPVPAGVNLHNGYIEIINHVQYHDGFSVAGVVKINEKTEGDVSSGGTFLANWCCILAGSSYIVELDFDRAAGARIPIRITPRLCNIRGIPFGYAVIEYTGRVKKTAEGSGSFARFETFGERATRIDTACPVEK